MNYCPSFKGLALSTNTDEKLLARLRCKQWSCPYCGEKNRSIWKAHLLSVLPELSREWSFLTLTCMPSVHRKKKTLEFIIGNFDKLMKRLKRLWGSFHYVRVYEKHQSGQFHAHLLISGIPEDALEKTAWGLKKGRKNKVYKGVRYSQYKKALTGLGFGFMCDYTPIIDFAKMSPVPPHVAVGYVTKYLTKNMDNLPKGTRRIQASQGIGFPRSLDDEKGLEWVIRGGVYERDIDAHGIILDISTGHEISYDDFLYEDAIYPRSELAEKYHQKKLKELGL